MTEENIAENLVFKGESSQFQGNLEPSKLRVETPDGRLAVEFWGDGTVKIGDLPYPELVSALREAFLPIMPDWRPCWCGPSYPMAWHECPVHGGALAREIPMETHYRRMHDAYRIAQKDS